MQIDNKATDIPSNVGGNQNSSANLEPNNDLLQSKYNFRYLTFPSDIGFDQMSHYMVININVPVSENRQRSNIPRINDFATLLPNELSKVDLLKLNDGLLNEEANLPTSFTLPRWTRRIAQSIALHMPNPLIYNTQNIYQEVSLTNLAGQFALGVASYSAGLLQAWRATQTNVQEALQRSSNIFDPVTGQAVGTAAAMLGNPINPAVEVLFATTPQRQFTFEVMMAPRNETESLTVQSIVRTLRFHAAPELNLDTYGATWIPPAEFDITFFNKGVENVNLLRINTCVLERVEVDYAPTGTYATFRNGHPVAVRLSLGFRELEPVHKQRVLQGF